MYAFCLNNFKIGLSYGYEFKFHGFEQMCDDWRDETLALKKA